jgi:hypothetical protein
MFVALKGPVSPFQGWLMQCFATQGGALGWIIAAFQAMPRPNVPGFICAPSDGILKAGLQNTEKLCHET